ncbi:hypothetical protein SAMN05660776_1063 [Salegentibacter holothuriorum]|uniref:Uncharacterized protein n=1 Tax=Salegentibacter holothuriorum TaxID=241145 RepID=A0A1T5BBM2_9FLAO|nr:hypothetical protein [Salegentibacter holothuriorum]SKB44656.1 hypothetical protein SAMN05660776_1063 [Salegentibacter holothuriorum]
MKKYILLFVATLALSFAGCDHESDFTSPNYAALQAGPADIKVELGGSTSYELNVYTANIVNEDRVIDIVVRESSSMSPAAYSLPETVVIPGGSNEAAFTVDVQDVNFSPNGESLIIGLAAQENFSTGDDFQLNVSLSCDSPLVIDFVFDGYANETTWNVKDTDGNTILEGGPYAEGAASATVERCLPDGDYTFSIFDAYGDGLTFPNEGSVTLTFAGEELVVIPGDFDEEATEAFTLGGSSSAD